MGTWGIILLPIFHQIIGFSTELLHTKNCLASSRNHKDNEGNEKINRKGTGLIGKTKPVRAAQLLADFFAIVPWLLLCQT